jgi:hypothetical protein
MHLQIHFVKTFLKEGQTLEGTCFEMLLAWIEVDYIVIT